MHFEIKNGHLRFVTDSGDIDQLEVILDRTGDDHQQLREMLDVFGYMGNGALVPVLPSDIGALTDSPIVTDAIEFEGDSIGTVGNLWWFPQYESVSFLDQLLRTGSVIFTAAPESVRRSTTLV